MKTKLKTHLMLSLLLACSAPAFAENHEHHQHHQHETTLSAPSTDSVFNINDQWTDANGKTFQLSKLGGKPTVIAMIYTSCQYVCPLTVQNIKRIERSLTEAQAGKVKFALFSFEPERDTPAILTAVANLHGITSPSWTLAQGSAGAVRKLAVTLGVKYKKVAGDDFEHDAIISILDSNGVIKFQADAMNKNLDAVTEALKAQIQ